MNIEIQPASIADKLILRHLFQLYLHDFSVYDDADVDEHGLYDYPRIDHYWTENTRYPFLVWIDNHIAGFALVRELEETEADTLAYSIAEYFILRKYRRQGAGKEVAFRLFDRFRGRWHVGQYVKNEPSHIFWRKVINEYTNGQFEQIRNIDQDGPALTFSSEKASPVNSQN
ncbi:MAG: GNAT family N-acetyltransferase [Anaerolineae bacterium]|nr:GNAT family N-acetyltransferase [Anaerolineae bacterium]